MTKEAAHQENEGRFIFFKLRGLINVKLLCYRKGVRKSHIWRIGPGSTGFSPQVSRNF